MRDVTQGLFGRSRSSKQVRLPDADESFGPFLACPVAVDGTRADVAAGVAAGMDALPASRPPEDAGSYDFYSLLASAEQFIMQFYTENLVGEPGPRLWHIRREIEATGTYRHTAAELEFGARVAWRNKIGRASCRERV